MPLTDHARRVLSATVCSGDGRRIGPVTAGYLDGLDRVVWATVRVGVAAAEERVVPLVGSWLYADLRLVIVVPRRMVMTAPTLPDLDLAACDEDALARHYVMAVPTAGGPDRRLRRVLRSPMASSADGEARKARVGRCPGVGSAMMQSGE